LIRFVDVRPAPAVKHTGAPIAPSPAILDCETWPTLAQTAPSIPATLADPPQTIATVKPRKAAKARKPAPSARKAAKPRTAANLPNRHKQLTKPIREGKKPIAALPEAPRALPEQAPPLAPRAETQAPKPRKAPQAIAAPHKAPPAREGKEAEKADSPLAVVPSKKTNGRSLSRTARPATNTARPEGATNTPSPSATNRGAGNKRLTDPDAYRAYQRDLMAKRRAAARAGQAPPIAASQ
jgi:hypothetical protein